MSDVLIANVKLVEKYKQAIPEMEQMLALGGYSYIAGSLILNIPNPTTNSTFTTIDIKPIDDYASDIIRKGQYIASQIFVKNKAPTCHSYALAQENIEKYELAHGRESEPSGTVEIN